MIEDKKSIEEYKLIISELLENISKHKGHMLYLQENNKVQEQAINQLNNTLITKDRLVVELETKLKQKEKENTELNEHVIKLTLQVNEQDARLKESLRYINLVNSSILMQISSRYRNIINRILPLGTTGRGGYELLLSAIRITLSEGPKAALRKTGAWYRNRFIRKDVIKFDPKISRQIVNTLKFKSNINPMVSIIIPYFCNWKLTLNCLRSIYKNTPGNYEIILVDDASTDDSYKVLSGIQNIKIIKNQVNSGFNESCNNGVEQSRSDFILFLNNDTLVTRGWLSSMMDVMLHKDVGAVGSKLIYQNGRLQEAGNIIWKDGNGWNYGRNDDPAKPEYNFLREVDYCSGACLLVRKDLFIQSGKFDNRYKPAYYEDVDICFSFRKAGYKTIYQPKSVVVHLEGASCGTDMTSGTKKYQEINRGKFITKWKDVLNSDHYEYDTDKLFCARTANKGKRILVIDQWAPRYDRDAGSLRMSYVLRILSELNYNVTFIGDDLLITEPYSSALQEMGIETTYRPYVNCVEDYIKANAKHFDIVWLSRLLSIKYIDSIKAINPEAQLIFDTVDLSCLRLKRKAEIDHDDATSKLAEDTKKQEYYLMQNVNKTIVVSEYEKQLVKSDRPSFDVNIVSLIHDIYPPVKTFNEREGLLYVGGFDHMPNIDAVNYFISDIFPLVKKKFPGMKIYIVGNIPSPHPAEQVLKLQNKDIIVTGYVKDLTKYFENCRVFVAPIRYGAGVKGKITQSMSHGLPVVTTDIGSESIYMIDGENGLIANDAHSFADKIITLYTDERLWKIISQNSVKNIKEHFSYDIGRDQVRQLIEGLSSPKGV